MILHPCSEQFNIPDHPSNRPGCPGRVAPIISELTCPAQSGAYANFESM